MYIRGMGDYGPSVADIPYVSESSGGDCGCGCGGGGGCGGHSHGMGLFDSMDPTTWGAGEYIVAGGIGYFAIKLMGDAQKVGRRARRSPKTAGGLGFVGVLALAGGAYYLWSKSQAAAGMGDYMPQSFVNPQRLIDPTSSSAIQIPRGW